MPSYQGTAQMQLRIFLCLFLALSQLCLFLAQSQLFVCSWHHHISTLCLFLAQSQLTQETTNIKKIILILDAFQYPQLYDRKCFVGYFCIIKIQFCSSTLWLHSEFTAAFPETVSSPAQFGNESSKLLNNFLLLFLSR